MELIDIGCNLTHDSFDEDLDSVLERARSAGVALGPDGLGGPFPYVDTRPSGVAIQPSASGASRQPARRSAT